MSCERWLSGGMKWGGKKWDVVPRRKNDGIIVRSTLAFVAFSPPMPPTASRGERGEVRSLQKWRRRHWRTSLSRYTLYTVLSPPPPSAREGVVGLVRSHQGERDGIVANKNGRTGGRGANRPLLAWRGGPPLVLSHDLPPDPLPSMPPPPHVIRVGL